LTLQDHANVRKKTRLKQQVFYRYRLHVHNRERSLLFYGCRLFQQYIVNAFTACKATRLTWIRTHQTNIRADLYNGLVDAIIREDATGKNQGRRIVLPASFTGSDRFMQRLFQDSIAIISYFGKPNFFITFTANPQWPEILRELKEGQNPLDQPDLITRIFRLKCKEFLADLHKGVLGEHEGHLYTIKYQKHGLPHIYILLFVSSRWRFTDPILINEVICIELPDPEWDPTDELTRLVLAQITHGPCGTDYPKAPCMARETPNGPLRYRKRFPKQFHTRTIVRADGYPEYRRRDDGRTFAVPNLQRPGQETVRDNRWIVPYNPYLLRKYQAHINVEICATIKAIQYITKYVYKGADQVTVQLQINEDEIAKYLQARYAGPAKAIWRLFKFPVHQEYPPVESLAIHLKGEQPVYFPDTITGPELALRMENARSTLMAYFQWNTDHPDEEPKRLYSEFPKYFT
jgi:hypothetical protein